MSIILFLLILTFLIVIHELGHFIAARIFKVHIEEFGIGLPPKAFTMFSWKGIPFTFNWLPIGGFVRMEGENGEGESGQSTDQSLPSGTQSTDQTFPFYTRKAWQRLIIVLAGVVINFLFGILAFTIMFAFLGIPTRLETPRISYVAPNSPAEVVGFAVGDDVQFIAVNGSRESIESTDEFIRLVQTYKGQEITVGIVRNGEPLDLLVRVRTDDEIPAGEGALGVALNQEELRQYPWYEMPIRGSIVGVRQSIDFGVLILRSLGTMVSDLFTRGTVPSDVAGPVGIAYQVQKENIFSFGPLAVINFAAILSVNLAIMNLLPIPALDGGRAVFILIERVFSKEKRGKIEQITNSVGMLFLLVLLLLITIKDVAAIVFR